MRPKTIGQGFGIELRIPLQGVRARWGIDFLVLFKGQKRGHVFFI